MGFVKKVLRALRPSKVLKAVTPYVGAVTGHALGLGPAGSIALSALLGSTQRGKGHKLEGALKGAAHGFGYNAFVPTLADKLLGATAQNSPMISKITGLSSPSLLNQLGISSAPAMGGGLGLIGNAGHTGLLPNLTMGKVMNNALGALKGVEHPNNPFESVQMEFPDVQSEFSEMPMLNQGMNANGNNQENPMFYMGAGHPKTPLSPLDILKMFSPKIPFGKNKNDNKEKTEEKPKKQRREFKEFSENGVKFARGGKVELVKKEMTGYIRESDSGGQDDDIYMKIPPKSYVMNGTDVSLYGDGNTENGVKKLKEWEASIQNSASAKKYKAYDNPKNFGGKSVEAMVSNGEYVLKPSTVITVGNGNFNRGVKIIDKGRDKLRKQKGVKAILPPRTKKMSYYMKGGY